MTHRRLVLLGPLHLILDLLDFLENPHGGVLGCTLLWLWRIMAAQSAGTKPQAKRTAGKIASKRSVRVCGPGRRVRCV